MKTPEYNGAIPVVDIVPDWENRKPENAAADKDLDESIKEEGLLQPVVLRPCPKFPKAQCFLADKGSGRTGAWIVTKDTLANALATDEEATFEDLVLYEGSDKRDAERAAAIYRSGAGWQLIAGERRWRAHVRLGIKTIAGRIHRDETNQSAALKQGAENKARLELNPMDEVRQMKRLSDLEVPQKEIGKRFGNKSQPAVANLLKLLQLPAKTQDLVATNALSVAHAQEFVRFAAWPKAIDVMAAALVKNNNTQYEEFISAKNLRDDEVPFARELVNAGLAVEIYAGPYSRSDKPSYTVTPAMIGKEGFYKQYDTVYYFLPENPEEPNLWEPEKALQDKARAAKTSKASKSEGARQSRMTPAQKAERQKTIADNKQARAESALAGVRVIERIKAFKDYDGASIAVLAATAIGAHWKYGRNERVKGLATKLGIILPKGFDSDDTESMAKLKPVDAMRLAVAALCDADCEESVKYAHPICDRVEHVLGPKVTVELRKKASDELAAAAEKKGKKS